MTAYMVDQRKKHPVIVHKKSGTHNAQMTVMSTVVAHNTKCNSGNVVATDLCTCDTNNYTIYRTNALYLQK